MSAVSITHLWSDGTTIEVTVEVDDDYPDSLSEAEARCVSVYRSVVVDTDPAES